MSKKSNKEIDLKDFIWEEEEFKFQPKENRHGKFLHAKKKQLQKEHYADAKDKVVYIENNILFAKRADAEKRLAYEDYDLEDDDDFVRYRIK